MRIQHGGKPMALAILLCLSSAQATAGDPPVVVAEQVAIDYTSGTGVGDTMNQQFAQIFQVRGEGYITHAMVPLNCVSSPEPTLVVSIQELDQNGLPSGAALAVQSMRGWRVDSVSGTLGEVGMRMIVFSTPARVHPGRYALTLNAMGGSCQLWYGPLGDTYTQGNAYLGVKLVSRLGWFVRWTSMPRDLAFQVYWKGL